MTYTLQHKLETGASNRRSFRCLKPLVEAVAFVQEACASQTANYSHLHPYFPMLPKPLFELLLVFWSYSCHRQQDMSFLYIHAVRQETVCRSRCYSWHSLK